MVDDRTCFHCKSILFCLWFLQLFQHHVRLWCQLPLHPTQLYLGAVENFRNGGGWHSSQHCWYYHYNIVVLPYWSSGILDWSQCFSRVAKIIRNGNTLNISDFKVLPEILEFFPVTSKVYSEVLKVHWKALKVHLIALKLYLATLKFHLADSKIYLVVSKVHLAALKGVLLARISCFLILLRKRRMQLSNL